MMKKTVTPSFISLILIITILVTPIVKGQTTKVSETNLNDSKNGQALKVTYTDYQKLNESLFPSALQINTLSGTKKINIDLQYVKIDGNVPVDFPFSVPKRYTLVK